MLTALITQKKTNFFIYKVLNPVPCPTDKLFGSLIPRKILSNFFFVYFQPKKYFFDSAPGSEDNFFLKNVSLDTSIINFKLKTIKICFTLMKFN